jgi:wyosine [tRNA(Phe)-imidazoG37] synthetase (radical SAM superfamily)
MDCITNGGMFLRSNGDLVCWDDAGYDVVLQRYDAALDYSRDVYLGPVYNAVRRDLSHDTMPQTHACRSCAMMCTGRPFSPGPLNERRLSYFQIEPSFACQLACANCYPGVDRRQVLAKGPAGHLVLKVEAYRKIITDLFRDGVRIDLVEFQGHGEPLVNPKVWEMVRLTADLYPRANIKIITNANFVFKEEMADAGVTEMVFAIDGVDQETYAPYRKFGNFDKCFEFMSRFSVSARWGSNKRVKSVWKYILFEHNDSVEHLAELKRLAMAAGVDEVMFIITSMGPRSSRFFRAIVELWDRKDESPEARHLLESLDLVNPVSTISRQFVRCIGWSPFPPNMQPEAGPRFLISRYGQMHSTVDANIDIAQMALEQGRIADAGNALVAFATKLWQLYEGRYGMLGRLHKRLIARCLALLPRVSPEAQRDAFVKLVTFADQFDDPTPARLLPHPCFLYPVSDLIDHGPVLESTGIDPFFVVFSRKLKLPSGRVRISYDCKTHGGRLEDPTLYLDDGRGYTEDNRISLAHGPLQDYSAEIVLPGNLKNLRFDPANGPGVFEIRNFLITPLN